MAYGYERDEWRSAVHSLSDAEREYNKDSRRRALGIVGDPEDALSEENDAEEEEV